jgi:mono/diheme cytochrome c family protein
VKPKLLIAIATGIALGAAGLSVRAWPWTQDMSVTPVVRPHAQPRTPPDGVVAIDGQRVWDRNDADTRLKNPLPATDAVRAEGAALFGAYCAVCHGSTGEGGGPVASYYKVMPDLTGADVQQYSDGWLFSVITEGGLDMPAQAEALSLDERWAIVHHIRSLGQP